MKLGILVNSLQPSQLAYDIIKNLNLYVDKKPDLDAVVFYENYGKPCFPLNFAFMQAYEAYNYDGILIGTQISNVIKMSKFPTVKHKFFYVWDLEWLRVPYIVDHNYFYNVYGNKEIKLIARSDEHKKVIERCWNVKVYDVVDDFDMDKMLEVINENIK